MKNTGRNNLNPRLLALFEKSEDAVWLMVNYLEKEDLLEIQTRNTLYKFTITDPLKRMAMANSNGLIIVEETEVCIGGSTLTGTGSMLKLGAIAVGFSPIVFIGSREIVLSYVKEVRVNGVKALPREEEE